MTSGQSKNCGFHSREAWENALFVVRNREPYMRYGRIAGQAKCIRPASGVVTAINPILYACGGVWVAHGSGNADWKFTNSKNKLGVPPTITVTSSNVSG